MKKGETLGAWRTRYSVLMDGSMHIFQTQGDTDEMMHIPLISSKIQKIDNTSMFGSTTIGFAIESTVDRGKVGAQFRFTTAEERDEWIKAVREEKSRIEAAVDSLAKSIDLTER